MPTSVTFTFGPPADPETRDLFASGAQAGVDPDWAWVLKVRFLLLELAGTEGADGSPLDNLVSRALGEPVTVTAHDSHWRFDPRPRPTLELVSSDLRRASDGAPTTRLASPDAQQALAALLRERFETEWVHVMAFEKDQEGSPSSFCAPGPM